MTANDSTFLNEYANRLLAKDWSVSIHFQIYFQMNPKWGKEQLDQTHGK